MTCRRTLLAICFACLLAAAPAAAQTPTPTPTATPEVEGVLPGNTGDFQICLYTGRRGNPYVLISILPERRADYESDPRNIIPAPPEGCPTRVRQQPGATQTPAPAPTSEPEESEPEDDESAPAPTGGGATPDAAPLEPGLPGAPAADTQALAANAIPMTGSRPLETMLFGLAFLLIGAGAQQLLLARR